MLFGVIGCRRLLRGMGNGRSAARCRGQYRRPAQGICERPGPRAGDRHPRPRDRAGRVLVHRRPLGLRQVDIAAHSRRARPPDRGHHCGRGRRLVGAERHGVPGERIVSLDERRDERPLRADDARRARAGGQRACRRCAQARGPDQVPPPLPAPALGRHAAAQRHRARLRDRSGDAADGRAVRRARCAEPRHPAGRAGADLARDPQDCDLCHPFHRGSAADGRPLRGHDRAAGPHQTHHRRPLPAPARSDRAVGSTRVRSAEARHLAGAGAGGDAGARGARAMNAISAKTRDRLLYMISPLLFLALWQLLLMAGIGDRRFIPAPSDIAVRFWQLVLSGELAMHTGVTLLRVCGGFFIGAIPGVACGLLMAMFRPVRFMIDPLIAALFPIPKIALMPLLLLAFGFGDASKIALVAIAVFFPVCVNTYVGAANIDKIYWDVARNYGASQTVMFTRIVFFGALPTIFAGIRIAVAVSFIVLVAAEFVATKAGIGYLIWNSWELLQVDIMFCGIVTIGILGLISSALLQEIERKVIPWKAE